MIPKLLYRYIAKNNFYYLLFCIVAGIFIYLLVDLFDRLDNFLSKGVQPQIIISYFLWKIPVILSQIFPLVFFLTSIIQFSLMKKNREWEAIEGGGIFVEKIILFLIVYSLFFSSIHLLFSQYLGNYAQEKVDYIWDSLGKKQRLIKDKVEDIWFRKQNIIGFIKEANIESGECVDVTLYVLDNNFSQITNCYYAKYGKFNNDVLVLKDVINYIPNEFKYVSIESFTVKGSNIKTILEASATPSVEDIPVWTLKKIISEMKKTGTNIEDILTVWYSKISYSFSMVVLSLVAFFIGRKFENIPLTMGLGLCISLIFYGLFVLGTTLGKSGDILPFLGAFGVHIVFGSLLIYVYMKDLIFFRR